MCGFLSGHIAVQDAIAYNTLVFPYATLMCVLLLIHGFPLWQRKPKTRFYDNVGVVCICENQRVCKASA